MHRTALERATRRDRSRWRAWAVLATLAVLGGCAAVGTGGDADTAPPAPTTGASPSVRPTPTRTPSPPPEPQTPTAEPASGLVYYAGRRARTGEWLLFAEPARATGREALLAAVRSAMAGPPIDPDYTSLWGGAVVESVRLFWDGDEGYYSVRLPDDDDTTRRRGMSMRKAHLAIQQVVWTLQSVGETSAPVVFTVGRPDAAVTDLLGVPATGPYGSYLPADRAGVLSSMMILAPRNGATVDGSVEVSGLAESFEATVGLRVLGPGGEVLLDDSAMTERCCGRLFPWSYTLDTTAWPPGVYSLSALTDDPLGIAQGSDGPEIDTKTLTID